MWRLTGTNQVEVNCNSCTMGLLIYEIDRHVRCYISFTGIAHPGPSNISISLLSRMDGSCIPEFK